MCLTNLNGRLVLSHMRDQDDESQAVVISKQPGSTIFTEEVKVKIGGLYLQDSLRL
jgi:hypothetical protein